MSDFNDKFKSMMTEGAKIGNYFKPGDSITDPDGNVLKIKKFAILLQSASQNRWTVVVTYDYKAVDGTKGTESNNYDTFMEMLTGRKVNK